jgi:hypothetical protein
VQLAALQVASQERRPPALWQFDVIRPAASSGTNGSGIELRAVRYRGKHVLYQAHVPILNVEYFHAGISAGCGPTYLDWQNSETCFEANGTDVIPGFRLCSVPARTIIESGSDQGNFRGVAIFVQGQEAVLVSELQAGWYRYISQWRFHTDGTIRPRFGFAAANNPLHLQGSLSPRILAPRFRHSYRREQRRRGVQQPAHHRRFELAHEAVRDPPVARRRAQPTLAGAQPVNRRGIHDRAGQQRRRAGCLWRWGLVGGAISR